MPGNQENLPAPELPF